MEHELDVTRKMENPNTELGIRYTLLLHNIRQEIDRICPGYYNLEENDIFFYLLLWTRRMTHPKAIPLVVDLADAVQVVQLLLQATLHTR